MIKLVNGRIRWSRADVFQMARILDAEGATKRQIAYVPTVLKLADKKGMMLSSRAKKALAAELKWRRLHKHLKKLKDFPPNPFSELEDKFQKHQRADLNYLLQTGLPAYLLASQPGVGKTLIAIHYAWYRQFKRILVICPNSAKEQWESELGRWDEQHLPVRIVDGRGPEQIRIASMKGPGWTIGHWESLVHARMGYLQHPWDLVIADEAHNAQNKDAQRSETLHALARIASHRLALTAHPYTNSPDELWSILKFLYPERYKSYWQFFNMHVLADPKPFGGFEVHGARRPNLLKWELDPFTVRRTKKSLGWREPVHIPRHVSLTNRGAREYEKLRKQFFVELAALDGGQKILAIPSVLARVTRLRQYLIDPELVGAREKSVKYPEVLSIMNEIDGPPVIFTMYEQAATKLQKFLKAKKKNTRIISGDVSTRDRTKAKHLFLDGKLDALIVVIQAGGESLNLGGFGYVICLDLPWHPRHMEQLIGRVDRPREGTGEIVPTTVYRILVRNSYEQRMEERIENKFTMFREVFKVADLKELFA